MSSIKSTLFLTVILATVLCSCKSNKAIKSEIIDLDNPVESIEIKLSDIVSDMTFVPLQTSNDLLLNVSAGSSIITDKSIFTTSNDGIYQFDREGNFIRKVVSKGNGPNEFSSIRKMLVDEKRDILYLSEFSSYGRIKRLNISTSEAMEPIDFENNNYNIQEIDNNGIIYGVVNRSIRIGSDEPEKPIENIIAFVYDPTDETITKIYGKHDNTSYILQGVLKFDGNNMLFLGMGYADTLFRLRNNILSPIAPISLLEKIIDIQAGGKEFDIINYAKNNIIGSIRYRKVNITTGSDGNVSGITVLNSPEQYLTVDADNIVRDISAIYIDQLDYKIDLEEILERQKEAAANGAAGITVAPGNTSGRSILTSPPTQSGKYLFWVVQPEDFKELIEGKQQFEALNNSINEDDNQIFIIGKIK